MTILRLLPGLSHADIKPFRHGPAARAPELEADDYVGSSLPSLGLSGAPDDGGPLLKGATLGPTAAGISQSFSGTPLIPVFGAVDADRRHAASARLSR